MNESTERRSRRYDQIVTFLQEKQIHESPLNSILCGSRNLTVHKLDGEAFQLSNSDFLDRLLVSRDEEGDILMIEGQELRTLPEDRKLMSPHEERSHLQADYMLPYKMLAAKVVDSTLDARHRLNEKVGQWPKGSTEAAEVGADEFGIVRVVC